MSFTLLVKVGGVCGRHGQLTGNRTGAADLSGHLDFSFNPPVETVFFKLGAAAMVFTTAFFGFFSSRRRLVKPLAMVWFLW